MRNDEREPALAAPPAVGIAAVCAEPPAVSDPVRAKQARTTAGILDGFVHGDDPPETHGFQFFIDELLTDEAGDFGVWCGETTSFDFSTDLLRDPIVVLEEHALEDDDLVGHAVGRLEVVRAKQLLGIVAQAEVLAFQTLDPPLAGCTIAGNRKVDNTVLFAPCTFRSGDCNFSAKETLNAVHSAELVHDCLNLPKIQFTVFHDFSPFELIAQSFLTARELRGLTVVGHSQKSPIKETFGCG